MACSPPIVEIVSKETVKPSPESFHDRYCHLTPWDLALLGLHYMQKGLLFTNLPPNSSIKSILALLKTSLSDTLRHFYPLAGRLLTQKHREEGLVIGLEVCIDCNDEGVEFIHAVARNINASDVIAEGKDIPSFVNSFFPLDGAINHDGHFVALLAVQVTELADGALFIACCINHAVADGTSYWNFFNSWAEIARTNTLSRPPVLDKWFIEGQSPPVMMSFSEPSQFLARFSPSCVLRERFFHFSSQSVAKLKARANKEVGSEEIVISSLQALCALLWRAIIRARSFEAEQLTSCRLVIQYRERLQPKLSPLHFGNSIHLTDVMVTTRKLLKKGLGWVAHELNREIAGHTNTTIREMLKDYQEAPFIFDLMMFDPQSVMMGSSPKFDMYGCDFGFGKAAAVRRGAGNKFDGRLSASPGREGGGSIDVEVSLLPEHMTALLLDQEFLDALSIPSPPS